MAEVYESEYVDDTTGVYTIPFRMCQILVFEYEDQQ